MASVNYRVSSSSSSAGLNDPQSPPSSASSTTCGGNGGEKKHRAMNAGRHHRSSSLENNILLSNFTSISPFNVGAPGGAANKPQLSIAEPMINLSPSSTINDAQPPASPFAAKANNTNLHRYSSSSYHQPMSLGHMPPSTTSSSLTINEMQGHQRAAFGCGGGGSSLGGQSPLVPYYGTLKSKREQKRMQMGPQTAAAGGHNHHHHRMLVGNSLQQRISSVDDLRPGNNCNSISKSQVRLMREMFEQQQQKLNSKNFNSSEGGKMQRNSTTNLNRKYPGDEEVMAGKGHDTPLSLASGQSSSMMNLNGVVGGDLEMAQHSLSSPSKPAPPPPAIQPCSGVVVEMVRR